MTQTGTVETVAERQTGKEFLNLVSSLLKEGLFVDALAVLKQGLTNGAIRQAAWMPLTQIALTADMPDAFTAVDMIRCSLVSLPSTVLFLPEHRLGHPEKSFIFTVYKYCV